MTIGTIALMLVASLIGPALSSWNRWRVPVAVGELLVGVALGVSGLDLLPVDDRGLQVIANIGFALMMFVVGSHLSVRSIADPAIAWSAARAVLVSVMVAAIAGWSIVQLTDFGNWPLLVVLMASSSAAILLPIVSRFVSPPDLRQFIAQASIADLLAVMALPLVVGSAQFGVTAGVLALIAVCAYIWYRLLKLAAARDLLTKFHVFSKAHSFALELRISLIVVLGLAALAHDFNVTVMIAGFSVGIVMGTVGIPHRLSRQLFGITEGLFSPLFFIWLGANIDVRAAFTDSSGFMLMLLLTAGALLAHLATAAFGLSVRLALMTSAQLGVPAAAVAIGRGAGSISAGQGAAILAAALATILITTLAARPID